MLADEDLAQQLGLPASGMHIANMEVAVISLGSQGNRSNRRQLQLQLQIQIQIFTIRNWLT